MSSTPIICYSSYRRLLHWISAPLVILALYTGYYIGGHLLGMASYRLHITLGTAILLLTLVRLFLRITQPLKIEHTTLTEHMSGFAHVIIYALLIFQPTIAVVSKLCNGRSITLIGNIVIQPVLPKGTVPSHTLMQLHGIMGKTLLILLCLHVTAAMIHHFALRDNILSRMLPIIARK